MKAVTKDGTDLVVYDGTDSRRLHEARSWGMPVVPVDALEAALPQAVAAARPKAAERAKADEATIADCLRKLVLKVERLVGTEVAAATEATDATDGTTTTTTATTIGAPSLLHETLVEYIGPTQSNMCWAYVLYQCIASASQRVAQSLAYLSYNVHERWKRRKGNLNVHFTQEKVRDDCSYVTVGGLGPKLKDVVKQSVVEWLHNLDAMICAQFEITLASRPNDTSVVSAVDQFATLIANKVVLMEDPQADPAEHLCTRVFEQIAKIQFVTCENNAARLAGADIRAMRELAALARDETVPENSLSLTEFLYSPCPELIKALPTVAMDMRFAALRAILLCPEQCATRLSDWRASVATGALCLLLGGAIESTQKWRPVFLACLRRDDVPSKLHLPAQGWVDNAQCAHWSLVSRATHAQRRSGLDATGLRIVLMSAALVQINGAGNFFVPGVMRCDIMHRVCTRHVVDIGAPSLDESTFYAYATKVLAATPSREVTRPGAACGCKRRARYVCFECGWSHEREAVAPWLPKHGQRAPPPHVASSFLYRFLRALEDVALGMAYGHLRLLADEWKEFFPRFKRYCAATGVAANILHGAHGSEAAARPAFNDAHGLHVKHYVDFMCEHTVCHGFAFKEKSERWESVATLLLELLTCERCGDIGGMRPARAAGACKTDRAAARARGVLFAFGHAEAVKDLVYANRAHGEAGLTLGAQLLPEHQRGLLEQTNEAPTVQILCDVIDWVDDMWRPNGPLPAGYHAVNAVAGLSDPPTDAGPLDLFAPRATDGVVLCPLQALRAYARHGRRQEAEGGALDPRHVVRAHALEAGLRAHDGVFRFAQAKVVGGKSRVQCVLVRDAEGFAALRAATQGRIAKRRIKVTRFLAHARAQNADCHARLRLVHTFLMEGYTQGYKTGFYEVALLRASARKDVLEKVRVALDERQMARYRALQPSDIDVAVSSIGMGRAVTKEELLTKVDLVLLKRRVHKEFEPIRDALGIRSSYLWLPRVDASEA